MVKDYKWYDCLQYAVLWLLVAAVVINWRAGLWMTMLFLPVTMVKMIAQRKVGNPALGRALRWTLCAPVVYWIVLALSLLWTSDVATGLEVLRLKAVLLVCPLCLLVSDTSYFTANHLRGLGYALLLALCGSFAYFAVKAGIAMSEGTSLSAFQGAFYASRVLPETTKVDIAFESRDGVATMSTDNQTMEIEQDWTIHVEMAQFSLKRIRLAESGFVRALTSRLFWGEDMRNNG